MEGEVNVIKNILSAIPKFHFTLVNFFNKLKNDENLKESERKKVIAELTDHAKEMDTYFLNKNRIKTINTFQSYVRVLTKEERSNFYKELCYERKRLADEFNKSYKELFSEVKLDETKTEDNSKIPNYIKRYVELLQNSIGYFGTIINIVFKPYFNEIDKLEEDAIPIQNYFELLANVDTESCYNVLRKNNFINSDTTKKVFNSLFNTKGGVKEKISWTGSLNELARFIFLLHNNNKEKESEAVCKRKKGIYEIACKCFSHNGNAIDTGVLRNNNRDVKDEERYKILIKAIAHLKKPEATTRKKI